MTTAAREKGKLKIYLGYAAGVGKTYQMLDDAQVLRRQGVDVVIGYFEPHGRADTIAKTEGLEIIPCKRIEYRGTQFGEMDTDAILRRNPAICLVDELAHTNVPGSERVKRWEDVRVLTDNGITVHSTLNVQHLESFNDQVWQLTGIRVRETLPDWVVNEASEVILVDVTPQALRNRLERGAIYGPEKAAQALTNFFTEQNLGSLRELTLRHAAHEVEGRLTNLPVAKSAGRAQTHRGTGLSKGPMERILVCLDEKPSTAMLIRRGLRVADYLNGECCAVFVLPAMDWTAIPPDSRAAIENHLSFARNLRIATQVIDGANVANALVDFARDQKVTQIYMGRTKSKRTLFFARGDTVQGVVRLARDIQVVIVSEHRRKTA